jgi:DNA modification methylase
MKKVKTSVWDGCYDKQLKGFIVPEAFSHPAKYSLGLIERIFDYCLERGYLEKGSVVGDCFGGVAIGGLVAAYRGLTWIGCELEPRFVALSQQNIALHKSKLAALGRPLPTIIQGDSRKFHEHVQAAGIVSSPPFVQSGVIDHEGQTKALIGKFGSGGSKFLENYDYGQTPGQIGRLKAGEVAGVISSPPYNKPFSQEHPGTAGGQRGQNGEKGAFVVYGATEGQIEGLKNGEVQAVISSPPYSDIAAGAGGLNTKPASKPGQQVGRSATAASQDTDQRYGKSAGQISRLKGGSVDSIVSSPPYITPEPGSRHNAERENAFGSGDKLGASALGKGYGHSDGQISQLKGGSVEAVVSSPPWENNNEGVKKASKFKNPEAFANNGKGHYASPAAKLRSMEKDEQRDQYGDSPGQIGKLKGGDIDGLVSSPPYRGRRDDGGSEPGKMNDPGGTQFRSGKLYGQSKGQIGDCPTNETYWEAMAQVYASCFLAIKPGGVIVLVVKDYVKGGKRVPLCDDTCRLLEHLGFTVIERIHAMLVKETRETNLDGSETVTTKSRKSFFRRLAEKKGSPRIDFEEVLIARRP